MIEFRQKNFNVLSDIIRGASIGGSVGSGYAGVTLFRKGDSEREKEELRIQALKIAGGGILIGAALGALVGGLKELSTRINRRNTVDRRLMSKVVEVLKKDGFKEGIDFTKDPRTATQLKTKVCVVISKISGDLRISVNMMADPKLKTVSDEIIKRLPNTSATTEKLSDKFNDITITSISDSSADTGLVVGVIEKFIHSGYQVYLVEVG